MGGLCSSSNYSLLDACWYLPNLPAQSWFSVGTVFLPCPPPPHRQSSVEHTYVKKKHVLNVDSVKVCCELPFSNAAWKRYKTFVDLVFPHSQGHCEQTHYPHWLAQLPWKLITCLFIQKEKGSWLFKQNACYDQRVMIPSHKEIFFFLIKMLTLWWVLLKDQTSNYLKMSG